MENHMGKQLSSDVDRACQESTITIITADNYFYLAVKYLIHSMLPEILSKKGTIYNVVHCESVFQMDFQDAMKSEDRLLIADYDVRLIGNSHILELLQGMKVFRSVMLVLHKELAVSEVDYCLTKGAPVGAIKQILLDFILQQSVPQKMNSGQLLSRFTHREHQIIRLILKGRRVESIAKELNLSPKTIYAHRSRIYQKAGVRNLQGLFRCGELNAAELKSPVA
ncbi:hypothetical protein FEM41_18500 [Jejubacter calystegiae]|uniref:HTH luxR-type domain-containing protein n=2 Tax=Enterobacteriaceae TaxID=543 RepID=A0A4P8YL51_9ENTR|nr:hypothetical protein FEM41_18500 [Jejubacter calystegiae]